MIAIGVTALQLEPGSVELDAELEARCVGQLTVSDGRGVLFAEDAFPCLELALALRRWRSSRGMPSSDFEFDSMSYPDPGLVWIRRDPVSDDRWRVGSIAEPTTESELLSWTEVAQAIDEFIENVGVLAPEVVRGRVTELLALPWDA